MGKPRKRDATRTIYLKELSEKYERGWYQKDLARHFKVTQQQISYDIKDLLGKWKTATIENVDKLKKRELQKLNVIESEAALQWESEKNFMFLQVQINCVSQRCKILGISAPDKIEHSGEINSSKVRIIELPNNGRTNQESE